MSGGWSFSVGCPGCGGPLEHVTGGRGDGRMRQAIVACVDCRRVEQITVLLRTVEAGDAKRARRVPTGGPVGDADLADIGRLLDHAHAALDSRDLEAGRMPGWWKATA